MTQTSIPEPDAAEPSLGDLLAAALIRHAIEKTPPARVPMSEADIIVTCAKHCAALIGHRYDVTEADAWDQMQFIPDEMIPLLETYEGWDALGIHIAAMLGVIRQPVRVTTRH